MFSLKYTLPTLAIAEIALAQSSCSNPATTTIQNAGDATAIAACQTYSGSIALATDASGSISFDGSLQRITGNLVGAHAAGVDSLSASGLQTIGGDFILSQMESLTSIMFSQLNRIDGSLQWTTVPSLVSFNFGNGVQRISDVQIRDTQIQDLSNINLKSARNVAIGQNKRLNKLSWQLTSVENELSLDSNGGSAGFQAEFGNLASAGRITVNSVNSLAMNSLQNVTMGLNVLNSPLMSFSAPNLTMSGGLSIVGNPQLSNVSFPMLKVIKGPLVIQRDPKLTMDIEFPAVTNIANVNATGSFSELDLPKINTIAGAVYIQSSGKLSRTCSDVQSWKSQNVISAIRPYCSGGNSGTTSNGASGSGSGGSSTSTAAAALNYVPTAGSFLGATGLLAAMFGMY